ncbi:Ribosome biogenesis protein ytm1 [Taphrina deformans PYCC 5710]|uniref:Ribosome biogenesis protein YTM1 n=1 Tax=Taphrina deformans (strain PYCC 5710 / ATCC 11124 / CBS 356.35 / IMI 108563 / JCM 9778 / NBRC 8474) TaxID=1097556 RepID=R4XE83_TAPDE|nr:Ribosome biogenesis protein ytm1 [Taphrina deformans PYCC 5710]|eukprot:CCG81667.1 Ribosome biogenesis protein ytm1 [Taphrina deformans PYCC 5710]
MDSAIATETPAGSGSVQVRFTTKETSLEIESRPLLVPTSLKRYGLSEIVNHLLETEAPIPFSFLIEGELLGTSVEEYLTRRGLSSETTLEVEYIRSILPPSFLASYPHDDWISGIALTTDARIVTGSYDSVLRVWDRSQNCTGTGAGHSSAVKAIALHDRQLVSASMDRTLRLWSRDEEEGKGNGDLACLAELRGHKTSVESCDFYETGVVSGSADGILGIWDTTDALAAPFTSERQNRRKRVRGSGVGVLRPRQLHPIHTGQVSRVAYNPADRSTVYSAGWDHTLVTTDLTTLLPLSTVTTPTPLFSLLPVPHLSAVLSGGQRNIQIHDLRSTSLTRSTLSGHTSFVSSLAAAPHQEYLFASASFDGEVRVWDLRNEKSLYAIKRHQAPIATTKSQKTGSNKVMAVAWGEIGIVSGGEDCLLQINRGVDQPDKTGTGSSKI